MINSSSPNQPVQNYEIVNSTLEQQVSTLLPSVAGYGGNLRSTNTIIPVVDLTSAAEGSVLPESLNNAWDFATAFTSTNNTTNDVITNTGFYKVAYVYRDENVTNNSVTILARLYIDDGSSEATIWQMSSVNSTSSNETVAIQNGELYVFLNSGQTLKAFTSSTRSTLNVSSRQVANKSGLTTVPLNFS